MSKLSKSALATLIWICLIGGTTCWIVAFAAHGWTWFYLFIGEFIFGAWGIYFARSYAKRK